MTKKLLLENGNKLDRAMEDCLRATAARCRGRTLVVSRDGKALADLLVEQSIDVEYTSDPTCLSPSEFETVVVSQMLEFTDENEGEDLLEKLLSTLRPEGFLIINVPNEHCDVPGQTQSFTRKKLEDLAKTFGKTRLATDQPYRWISIRVTKAGAKPVINRINRNRMRVTARTCRGRVLELGCGAGHLTRAIADRGHEVLGVDISEEKIRRAEAYYPDLNFLASDILKLPEEMQSHETVLIAEVLEHVDEATGDAMLAKAWSLLAPGGRLVVSVPNEDCIPHRNHLREFTRKSLRRLLRPLGHPRLVSEQPFKWLLMTVEKRP